MASDPKRSKMSDKNSSSSTSSRKPHFNFSSSVLEEVVKMKAFVDKTLLIKEILEGAEIILITAPGRFCKSTNLDMVKKFVEIQVDGKGVIIEKKNSSNYQLFKNNKLKIFDDEAFVDEHFATYPVIFASFKDIRASSYEQVLKQFGAAIRKAYLKHAYLLESKIWGKVGLNINTFKKYRDSEKSGTLNEGEIIDGLQFLSECLCYYFGKKVFLLIDEYDAPINNIMFVFGEDELNRTINLLTGIFSNNLKGDTFVERAVLTGISYFATEGLSGANNIEKYMFLGKHNFVPYYGLTEVEANKLLIAFEIDPETQEKVKRYYNGYLSESGTKLYSLWSFLHFLESKKIQNYWPESGVMTNLERAINVPCIRLAVEALCLGKSVKIEMINIRDIYLIIKLRKLCLEQLDEELSDPDLYLNFILQLGYLTLNYQKERQSYEVQVLNGEIIEEFRKKLFQHYFGSINFCIANCAASFEKICFSTEDEIFQDFINTFNTVIHKLKKQILKPNEDTFHCIMFFVFCKCAFSFSTEFSMPNAKVDLIANKDDLGILVEMKYNQSPEDALKEIINKYSNTFKYDSRFEKVTRNIYLGLNISENNTASLSVLIDTIDLSRARRFCKT